jgi:hypothetical protein
LNSHRPALCRSGQPVSRCRHPTLWPRPTGQPLLASPIRLAARRATPRRTGRCRAATLSHATPGVPLSLPRRLRFKKPPDTVGLASFFPSLSSVHSQATHLSSTPATEPPRPSPTCFRPPSSPCPPHGETLPIHRHFPFWSRPHLARPPLQLPELAGSLPTLPQVRMPPRAAAPPCHRATSSVSPTSNLLARHIHRLALVL